MRVTILLSFLVLATACSTSTVLVIPGNQSVEIDYKDYPSYNAELKNKSMRSVEVAVLNKVSGEQVRGFGLGISNETIMIEQENKLVLSNSSNRPLKVKVGITERKSTSTKKTTTQKETVVVKEKPVYIEFTLLNKSGKSIPLIIPNVMNPNLSPFSSSGVSLKIGQEILFRSKGKKYVLLVVDETIKNGDKLDVGKLLKEKKEALGL